MSHSTLIRYYHTLRHLKIRQICFRLFYACHKPALPDPVAIERRYWPAPWQSPAWMSAGLSLHGELSFLSETGSVNDDGLWNNPQRSKLWLYNLHYFDSLNARDTDLLTVQLESLLTRWINENPPLTGNGWEPYPLSLRIVNWVKWFSRWPERVSAQWLESLALQATALVQRVEYHILGNHLFANAKALVFAGAYCAGEDADFWLVKGLRILEREIPEQFLSDGGHFERSPMYHAIMLWDMCDLYQLARCSDLPSLMACQNAWREVILKGLSWLDAMSHPDGDIAFFNDATLGIAPSYADLLDYARFLGIDKTETEKNNQCQLTQLTESGYYAVTWPEECKAILDLAPVGPDYQPGHAHADTLSFELSLFGQRLLVNSGISQYGEGAERLYERSTEAHNTVCVDGHNSSDVWAGFRVSQRACPFDIAIKESPDFMSITCSHDGYTRLEGGVVHTRQWTFYPDHMTVKDSISGQFSRAVARYYLHPDVLVNEVREQSVFLVLPNGKEVSFGIQGKGILHVQEANWHPGFGLSRPNKCLVIVLHGNELITRTGW